MGFKWSLVSVPDHLGVENVGGRIGAAFGPSAFFEAFSRLRGHRPDRVDLQAALAHHAVVGPLTSRIEENHDLAARAVATAIRHGDCTVVVGGGHDHGYSHLRGVRDALGPGARIACVNIDAHLDLRAPNPRVSSGSPFYLALEAGVIDGADFIEFGIQSHCNGPELWRYAERKRVSIVPWEACRNGHALTNFTQSLEKLASQADAVVISLDLDSAAESFAPGVSAPQSEGFNSTEIVELCEAAGANRKVISLGVFELNPCTTSARRPLVSPPLRFFIIWRNARYSRPNKGRLV